MSGTISELGGSHLRTYEKIFQHPISHNLEWRDVRTMLGRLGELTEGANGNLSMARNGHTLALHRTNQKDITDMHELMEIRHFLERSEVPLPPALLDGRVLVVISHHEARIFQSALHGAAGQTVKSHDSRYHGHAEGSKDFSRGKEIPAPESFFEPLAAALKGVRKILLAGCGSGNASAMEMFSKWLATHQPELASRIIHSVIVDEHHQSDGELVAMARKLYARLPAPPEPGPGSAHPEGVPN